MKFETLWRPDTCGCEIIYEWDDSEPESSRTHRLKRVVSTCDNHKGVSPDTLFDMVLEENRRKNLALSLAQSLVHTIKLENYSWRFDSNRVLIVEFSGLTASEMKDLQSSCNINLGAGKVIVR